MWQLFHPFTPGIVQPLFKSIHCDLVDSLDLSIPQWISRSGIPILNAQVTTVPPKGFAIKLKTIVRDKGMRDPKSSDNIFSHKYLGIHVPDVYQWFSFNPLGEVIRTDQQPSLIPCYPRKMSYNIQALLSKRPRARQMIEDTLWLMNIWGKFLTLVTLLYVLFCFLLHIRPLISLSEGSVRQGSVLCVASTNPFM